MINFFLVVMPLILSLVHPFHVSVCDIEFNGGSKSIQVSQRVFLNDLEKALNEKFSINLMIDEETTIAFRDSLIQTYVLGNFHILVDGKENKRVYIGNEIEEDAMWCYIEYEGVNILESLEVRSTVLLETFDDQANIIHFSYGDYEKSIRLDKLTKSSTFTL